MYDSQDFNSSSAAVYRRSFWAWQLSGGAVLDSLDWSFTVGHEDGSYRDEKTAAGPSGPGFRLLVALLARWFARLELASMEPATHRWLEGTSSAVLGMVPSSKPPPPRAQFAAFVAAPVAATLRANLTAWLGSGSAECTAEWTDTEGGGGSAVVQPLQFRGGVAALQPPMNDRDLAVLIQCPTTRRPPVDARSAAAVGH